MERSAEAIEQYILTTRNKTIGREGVLRVLEWHRSREKDLEDELRREKERRLLREARAVKQRVVN